MRSFSMKSWGRRLKAHWLYGQKKGPAVFAGLHGHSAVIEQRNLDQDRLYLGILTRRAPTLPTREPGAASLRAADLKSPAAVV